MKPRIQKYTPDYKEQLEVLLCDFSKEVFGSGTADIDTFVDYHWVTYLAILGEEVVGFSSFTYNTYFGLRPPTVGNDYLYVKPEHRKGRAVYLLSMQSAAVCIEAGIPLEHYYASKESKKLSKNIQGTFLYDVYEYSVEEVARINKRFTSKIKIKENKDVKD
jgi:hypothetical protein